MHAPTARRLGALTTLALSAGLLGVSPAHAATDCKGPAALVNNNAGNVAPVANPDTATVLGGTRVEIPVLANDSDPDAGDRLAVVSVTQPAEGTVCINSDNTVTLQTEGAPTDKTTTFRYTVGDGDRYREATVTVAVTALKAMPAQVRRKLSVRGPKAKRAAQVVFTNPNSRQLLLVAGSPKRERPVVQRYIAPGETFVLTTRLKRLGYVTALESEDTVTFVNLGQVNTRKGRVSDEYLGFTEEGFRSAPAAAWARIAR